MVDAQTHYEWRDDEEGVRYEIWPAKTIEGECPPGSTCFEVRDPAAASNVHVCDAEWPKTGPTDQDFRRIVGKALEKG